MEIGAVIKWDIVIIMIMAVGWSDGMEELNSTPSFQSAEGVAISRYKTISKGRRSVSAINWSIWASHSGRYKICTSDKAAATIIIFFIPSLPWTRSGRPVGLCCDNDGAALFAGPVTHTPAARQQQVEKGVWGDTKHNSTTFYREEEPLYI